MIAICTYAQARVRLNHGDLTDFTPGIGQRITCEATREDGELGVPNSWVPANAQMA